LVDEFDENERDSSALLLVDDRVHILKIVRVDFAFLFYIEDTQLDSTDEGPIQLLPLFYFHNMLTR